MPCWIHRGAIADAQKVVISQSTDAIIKFIQKRINMLRAQDIDIVCVFDGQKLPAKILTNESRRARRDEARNKARESLASGDTKSAFSQFMQGIGF